MSKKIPEPIQLARGGSTDCTTLFKVINSVADTPEYFYTAIGNLAPLSILRSHSCHLLLTKHPSFCSLYL